MSASYAICWGIIQWMAATRSLLSAQRLALINGTDETAVYGWLFGTGGIIMVDGHTHTERERERERVGLLQLSSLIRGGGVLHGLVDRVLRGAGIVQSHIHSHAACNCIKTIHWLSPRQCYVYADVIVSFDSVDDPNYPIDLGQLSLAIPHYVWAVSTVSESWDVNRHTARCTS